MADKNSIVDPFAITPTLKSQHETVMGRAKKTDDLLTGFINEADQIQARREQALGQVVKAKEAINDQVQEETQQFAATTAPIFQKRQAVAARQVELTEMNPLKRSLFGIFNRNYQPEHLAEVDQALAGQLSVEGQRFQSMMGVHDQVIKGLESDFAGQDSIEQLHMANAEQDVQLAAQSFGTARQVFDTEIAGLSASGEVMKAQAAARIDLLTGMTPEQINKAYAESVQNKGEVVVNGVTLRTGELKDAQMNWKEKQLALESRQLAIQSQKMGLADQYEQKLISHMTGPEIQQAIQSGGIYQGQKLNQELLTRAYVMDKQRTEVIVNSATTESAIPVAHSMIRQIGQNTMGGNARAASLFGQVPREMQAQATSIAARIQGFAEAERRARATGHSAEFVQTQLPLFQAMLKEQEKSWDSMAEKWSGGNKDLKAVATSWLSGTPLNSESSAKGLITLARNGLPPGTKLSGPAAAAFARAQQVVNRYDAGEAGKPIDLLMQGGKKKEMSPELIREVSNAMTKQYVGASMDSVLKATPQLARTVQVNGQPHPFSRVRPEDFQTAIQVGDAQGYKVIGQKLGLSADQAQTLFSKGPTGPVWEKVKAKHPDLDWGTLGKNLQAQQTAGMLQALDHSPSAGNGFKPSAAFTDLISNPQYQQNAMRAVQGQGNSSAGDFMVSQIGGTNFDTTFYNWSKSVSQSYAALQSASTSQAIESSAKLRNVSPWDSANITLNTIDGLNPAESRQLLLAVKKIVDGNVPANLQEIPNRQVGDMIDTVITKQKFQDPNLERIRQTAARDWSTRRPQIYNGLSGFLRAVDEAGPGDNDLQTFATGF